MSKIDNCLLEIESLPQLVPGLTSLQDKAFYFFFDCCFLQEAKHTVYHCVATALAYSHGHEGEVIAP